jgi:hypothetical protein
MGVSYTNDILPKFRPGDIGCMRSKGVHLGESNWMCNSSAGNGFADHGNARRVFAALSAGFMPPDGAWAQAWLDTYQNWMTDGFQP